MNPARPTSGGFEAHKPSLIIYWADTGVPLTHAERKALEDGTRIASVTTREILIKQGERLAVVRQIGDPQAPAAPPPKVWPESK